MLPKAPTPDTSRPAINRNFNDLDSLLTELNTPKEIINSNPVPPVPGQQNSGAPGFNPENQQHPLTDTFGGSEQLEVMPDEIAALSGKTIANTIDTALGTGMSLYAKNTQPEKYQATLKQINNLETAWAAVAKKYNYRVEDSPWFNVILLTVAIYLPHFQEAKNDRRFNEITEKIAEETAQRESLAKRVQELEEKPAA
jgi:hypothetical protein